MVGGLGLGYTLSAVLRDPRVRSVTVAEIEDALVRWHQDGTLDDALGGSSPANDDRVQIAVGDIRSIIESTPPGSSDVILLDVDNGPGYLVYDANAAVYGADFLTVCADRTRPGGVTGVWSAETSPGLLTTMEAVFGIAEEWPIPVILGQRATTYHLFLGRKQGESMPGDLVIRSGLTIPEGELRWRFSRSSGPGGQSVNTSDTRAELSFNIADTRP